jgi:hypothetical protein
MIDWLALLIAFCAALLRIVMIRSKSPEADEKSTKHYRSPDPQEKTSPAQLAVNMAPDLHQSLRTHSGTRELEKMPSLESGET